MEEKRVVDYFVISGLDSNALVPIEEFVSRDGAISPQQSPSPTSLHPITDITVIIRSQGETVPSGFTCIECTPNGFPADLNHGSIRSPSIFLCYRRGIDKPPLVDIGVLYESKERVMADSEVVHTTPSGRQANVNNSGSSKTFLTYRRARDLYPCNQLVVTDICVILANKGETPPHAFNLIKKTLNKGIYGSDVFVCYKKSMNRPPLLRYQPTILDRFPLEDYDCYSLPVSVPLFCVPMGATVECWPKTCLQPRPLFSKFVLTSDNASKVYGAAIAFYEPYSEKKLTHNQKLQLQFVTEEDKNNKSLNVIKSICILSRWPFFDTFERLLYFLYKTLLSSNVTPLQIPIERYISHFVLDIPFPSIQRPKILVQLGATSDETVLLSQPLEDMPLPLSGASFTEFLRTLGPEHCLVVLLLALAEQKILLHSLRPDVLTGVAEAITSLIFPFHWQCPYIPLCPLGLCDVLNAPLPFIVGVDSRYFDMYEPPIDVACVDLDTNSIYLSEQKRNLNVKLLPKRPARILKANLERLFDRLMNPQHKMNGTAYNSQMTKNRLSTSPFIPEMIKAKKFERQIDLEIQDAFLRFMASILRNFRSYLLPITRAPTVGATDPNSLFDFQNFFKSRDKTHQRFYHYLMRTQMFTRFIEERSFVSDKDNSLAFFDECLDKVEAIGDSDSAANIRMLETDEASQSDRTVFIPAPEPSSPLESHTYHRFGPLNAAYFHKHPVINKKQTPNGDFPDSESLSRSFTNFTVSESPVVRRTKQEIRSAQRVARRHAELPLTWAKCLVSYCYSLWFIHLPAYVKATQATLPKDKPLRTAYEVILRMQALNLHPPDEICYRILMLLCGVHSKPTLAVKVLFEMKRNGVTPNAITYGYYNKAVLESKWPAGDSKMWTKLRNVIAGVSEFRKCGLLHHSKMRHNQSLSNITDTFSDGKESSEMRQKRETTQSDCGYSSTNTVASDVGEQNQSQTRRLSKYAPVKLRKSSDLRIRTGSIVRSSSSSLFCLEDYNSSAGVLMTTQSFIEDSVFNSPDDYFSVRKRHKSAEQSNQVSPDNVPQRNITDLPSPKPCLRSYSFGNDARIIRNLKEGPLRALKHELERNHQIVPEEEEKSESVLDLTQQSQHSKLSCLKPCSEEPTNGYVEEIEKESKHLNSLNVPINDGGMFQKNQENESVESLTDTNSSKDKHSIGSNEFSSFSPLKDAFMNLNLFSPEGKVATSIRSSFRRLATSYQNKAANLSRSSTFHSSPQHINEKVNTKIPGIFRSKTLKSETPTKPPAVMTRSATLPVSPTKRAENEPTIVDVANEECSEQEERKGSLNSIPSSPWTTKISAKHLEYVNSTIRQAANTMASRLRSSLASSATNSPSKLTTYQINGVSGVMGTASLITQWASNFMDRLGYEDDECSSAHSLDFRRLSTAASEDDLSERSRESSLAIGHATAAFHSPVFDVIEQHYNTSLESNLSEKVVLDIEMTSSCRCFNCSAILFDEEIMEMWSADYSNLNTQCSYCNSNFVPFLTITLKFLRSNEKPVEEPSEHCELVSSTEIGSDVSVDEVDTNLLKSKVANKRKSASKTEFGTMEPFTVPYLSPLVLRKEVENVLQHEGDSCLINSEFVDEHPIIYWNLIWYFDRMNVPSHLRGLCLTATSVHKDKQNIEVYKDYDYRNVVVNCLWDNDKLHEDMIRPMFCSWKETVMFSSSLLHALITDEKRISRSSMRHMLASIQANDLITPIEMLVNERRKTNALSGNKKHYSVYRDLLFLSFIAIGTENIDHLTFDREYRRAFEVITSRQQNVLSDVDKPPSVGAIFCRRFFKRLKLKPTIAQTSNRHRD